MKSNDVATQRNHRRYRKILTRMWGDEKFCELSKPQPNAQSLWQFLICGTFTGPIPGLFHAGEYALAEALEWPIGSFRKKWAEIESRGMAKADWRRRVVWLPKAIQHNEPESPNVVMSWRTALDEIPECELKTEAVASLKVFLLNKGKAFAEAFAKAVGENTGHPLANQEQEQEQEQDPSAKGQPAAVTILMAHYHDGYLRRFGEKPQIHGAKDGAILKALARTHGVEAVKARIDRMLDSRDEFISKSGRTIGILQVCWNKLAGPLQPGQQVGRVPGCRHQPPCTDPAAHTKRDVNERKKGVA